MTIEKVFAKSDAKDVLALSKASAEAMLANFTVTIVLAGAKTDDEVKPVSHVHCVITTSWSIDDE
ncbi:hypothetical protein ALO70_200074 [Pseudomonas amygdali pv. eriobotryae]|uniref:Addiction module antitoxin n=3 Tax=Pseudomonas syringae group genomosp. 2 TaxID=251698 RepID=A0A0N8RGI3_PSEA0|nr:MULTISPECIES: hypothetical protein [Pseudomonas syringae group genomosp. 2]KPX10984.1 hypothetical protein ALO74_200039 [Pseudomonas syringae pv. cunninghamiae]KPX26071.1 hypothetical protein ALO70_200074 [Pseudomonas amygdali pv. eriobotryae]KWS75101.1 hypothetical protein AL052_09505 [Pseudomonas amygdali pv. eriobotryae]RML99510.1 hypothetical protein ALQ86_200011 [Pseudomonas amygdali pv. eriobotryae]RMO52153.1 hypothetical protein ALQ39_200103 [Pseudomonas amygdali pv. eriobotryae]